MPADVGTAGERLLALDGPDLMWSGEDYALAGTNNDGKGAHINFQRFASNGVGLVAPRPASFGDPACRPVLAWDGERYGLVWQTLCGQPGSEVVFALLDRQGGRIHADGTSCDAAADPECGLVHMTSGAASSASSPDVTWAGGRSFGIAWTQLGLPDAGDDEAQVYFARVDCN
jgi:hypothetical protein